MFEVFVKSSSYAAIHKDSCGHLRKHGGVPEKPSMYHYAGKFSTYEQALAYASSTGLSVKSCHCI